MDTYQILDIALNAAFFIVVALIAVVFSRIRERRVRMEAAVEASRSEVSFKDVLQHANATPAETKRQPSTASPREVRPTPAEKPIRMPVPSVMPSMSRAEREMANSIGLG